MVVPSQDIKDEMIFRHDQDVDSELCVRVTIFDNNSHYKDISAKTLSIIVPFVQLLFYRFSQSDTFKEQVPRSVPLIAFVI